MSKQPPLFDEDELAGFVSKVTAIFADFGTRIAYRAYTRKSPTTKLNALPSDVQRKIYRIVEE